MKTTETIFILGAGYLGLHFAKSLKERSPFLSLSCASEGKALTLRDKGFNSFKFVLGEKPPSSLIESDFLFIFIPPTQSGLQALKNLNLSFHQKVIYTSSIGLYSEELSSFPESLAIEIFSERQKLLLDMEKEIAKYKNHLILRLGGLYGEERNPSFSIAKKEIISNGETPINLLHLDDALKLFHLVLKDFKPGIFNLVSNGHPLKKDFYTKECRKLNLTPPVFKEGGNAARIIKSDKIKEVYKLTLPERFS